VNTGGARSDLERVVSVPFGPGRVIGFVTQENPRALGPEAGSDLIAVYLPMSYQIGGYTVLLPRRLVEPVDMSVEDALRFAVTAGMSKTQGVVEG
jgi:uncharacterized membrane protein